MYLFIEPDINKAVSILDTLLAVWRPPMRRSFFRPDMWWMHTTCPHCKRRVEWELERWKTYERVWHRGLCLRHWFIHHLSMVAPGEPGDFISNRPISIVADEKMVMFSIETVNYKYSIKLSREVAEMDVVYKGKTYRFTYRNHLNSYPYISSYMNLLFDVYGAMSAFRDFLTDYVMKHRVCSNIVINDSITLPPATDCPSDNA